MERSVITFPVFWLAPFAKAFEPWRVLAPNAYPHEACAGTGAMGGAGAGGSANTGAENGNDASVGATGGAGAGGASEHPKA